MGLGGGKGAVDGREEVQGERREATEEGERGGEGLCASAGAQVAHAL